MCSVIALFISLVITGCTHKMSVEEAMKVTLSLSTPAFAPPPRRINDITAVLDQPGEVDTELIKQLKAEADPNIPSDGTGNFYFSRAIAAEQLGHGGQALKNIREAVRLDPLNPKYLRNLSRIERHRGNFNKALDAASKSKDIKEDSSTFAELIELYTTMGDLQHALNEAAGLNRLCRRTRSDLFNLKCSAAQALAEARILEVQGKDAEAEHYIRKRIQILGTLKEGQPIFDLRWKRILADNLLKQGRFVDAEIQARDTLKESLAITGKRSGNTVQVLLTLARILQAQGRLADAEKLARLSVGLLESKSTGRATLTMSAARMQFGDALFVQGNYAEAVAQFDAAMLNIKDEEYALTGR